MRTTRARDCSPLSSLPWPSSAAASRNRSATAGRRRGCRTRGADRGRAAHRDRARWRARAIPRVRHRRAGAGVHPRLVRAIRTTGANRCRRSGRNTRVVTVDLAGHGGTDGNRSEWTHRAVRPGRGHRAVGGAEPADHPGRPFHGRPGGHRGRAAAQGPRHRHHRRRHLQVHRRARRPSKAQVDAIIKPFEADFIGHTRTLVTEHLFVPGRQPRAREQDRLRHVAVAAARRRCPSLRALLEYDFTEPLKDISVPIVAINSDLGEPVNEARIRKVLPKFRAVTLPGTRPLPHDGRPAALQPGAGNRNRRRCSAPAVASRAWTRAATRQTANARPRGRRELERLRDDHAAVRPGLRHPRHAAGASASMRLFGLVPGLGDIAGAMVAVYALQRGAQSARARRRSSCTCSATSRSMRSIGTVPILGDLFDFAFKAQTRNLALLDALARHAARDRAPQPSRAAARAARHRRWCSPR